MHLECCFSPTSVDLQVKGQLCPKITSRLQHYCAWGLLYRKAHVVLFPQQQLLVLIAQTGAYYLIAFTPFEETGQQGHFYQMNPMDSMSRKMCLGVFFGWNFPFKLHLELSTHWSNYWQHSEEADLNESAGLTHNVVVSHLTLFPPCWCSCLEISRFMFICLSPKDDLVCKQSNKSRCNM